MGFNSAFKGLIKGFSLHLVNLISINLLPPEANVLRNCIMLIHMWRTVDPKGYYTCMLWTKTDMTFSLTKDRGFNRGRKRICPLWGHTQPPFQWIGKDLSIGVRGRGCKLPSGPHLRMSNVTPPLPRISSCHAPELCLIKPETINV